MFSFDFVGLFDGYTTYHCKVSNGNHKAYTVVNNKLKYLCTIPF